MNPLTEGPITLAGPGLVHRPVNDSYGPGEYFELENVFITSRGTLKSRPCVQGMFNETGILKEMNRFVGHGGADPMITTIDNAPYTARTNSVQQHTSGYGLFTTAVLAQRPTAATDGGYTNNRVTVMGWFRYNNREYAITQCTYKPNSNNNAHGFIIIMHAPVVGFTPTPWNSYVAGDLVTTMQETNLYADAEAHYLNNPRFCDYVIKSHLMHKDRLWVATTDTVFFSKATQPEELTVPDGGFFKFPNMQIKALCAIGDLIYVIADSTVHVITYSTDPNVDSEVRVISQVIGGEDACVLGDTVFMVKPNAVYAVSGNNVSKIRDLDISLNDTSNKQLRYSNATSAWTQGGSFNLKIQAFEEALFITTRVIRPYSGVDKNPWNVTYSTSFHGGTTINAATYRLDMSNGAISKYSFGSNGYVTDMIYVPEEDSLNQTRLFFLGNPVLANQSAVYCFYLGTRSLFPAAPVGLGLEAKWNSNYESELVGLDTRYGNITGVPADATLWSEHPACSIKINNFSPDELRYLIKKFRSIMMELKVPLKFDAATGTNKSCMLLEIYAGEDWKGLSSVDKLIDTYLSPDPALDDSLNTETLRYGINQRCKRISIHLTVPVTTYQFLASGDADWEIYNPQFEINDIRTYWSATNRGPANDKLGS